MREKLLGLPEPPRKVAAAAAAAAAKTVEAAKRSIEEAKMSAEKNVVALRSIPTGKNLEAAAASSRNVVEGVKKSVEDAKISAEKNVEAVRSTPPGRNLEAVVASSTRAVEAAKKSVEEAKVSADKNVDAMRSSPPGKALEAVAASTRKSLDTVKSMPIARSIEAVGVSAGIKTAEVAASAAKTAEALGKSVLSAASKASAELGISPAVAAAAAYAAKKVTKDDPPPESRASETPPKRSTSLTDSGSSTMAAVAKADTEKPNADDQNRSVLGDARAKMAMVEKRAIEELRSKVAAAEAKAVAYEEKGKEIARRLKEKIQRCEDELRDTAAIEVALYSVTAEHTSSAHKVHTPARRLARLYVYAFKNWSVGRRASCARNSIQGLVVAVRACGNDVPRCASIEFIFSRNNLSQS